MQRTVMQRTVMKVLLALLMASSLFACTSMKSSLAERATFDLGCPVEEANITEIDSGQFGVVACGCKATYVSYPGWRMNSVSGEACNAPNAPRANPADSSTVAEPNPG